MRSAKAGRGGKPSLANRPGRLAIRRSGGLVFLGAALSLIGLLHIAWELPNREGELDFAHYYASSRILVEGGVPYRASLDSAYAAIGMSPELPGEWSYGVTNPPTLLYAVAPVARLPLRSAFWTWQALSLVALGLMLWLAGRIAQLPTPVHIFFAGLVLVSNAVFFLFYFGQVQAFVGALIVAGYWSMQRGRHGLSLSFVTAAGLLKLFPLILLPWFAWKARARWEAFLPAAALLGLSIGLLWDLWRDWIAYGLPVIQDQAVNQTGNFSAPSLVLNAIYFAAGNVPEMLGLAVSLAVAVTGYALVWRIDNRTAFAVLLCTAVAASLTAWMHYFVLVAIPFAVLIGAVIRRGSTPRRIIALSIIWLIVLGTLSLPFGNLPLLLLLWYLPLFGLGAMVFWLWREGRQFVAREAALHEVRAV